MFSADQIKSLNELEMKVYQYVMQHKATVPYMRIRELAKESYVSPTTVLRFCRKMDCDGYNEFKWRLKNDAGHQETKALPEDFREIQAFFGEMEAGKYEEQLEKAASMIAKAERILMAGIGNSGSIAQYGARYFTNMGKFSLFLADPFYPVNLLDSDHSLAIVLSVSGETKEMIEIINQLREAKCAVISITSQKDCTVAKLSDLNISYYMVTHREESTLDFSTQIPVVCLMETLGRKVRNRLLEE